MEKLEYKQAIHIILSFQSGFPSSRPVCHLLRNLESEDASWYHAKRKRKKFYYASPGPKSFINKI